MQKFLRFLQGVIAAGAITVVSQPDALNVFVKNPQSQTRMAAVLALAGAFLPALQKSTSEIPPK